MKRLSFVLFRIILLCLFLGSLSARRVVVIGGGLAGLVAAIEAHNRGAEVVLLEKEISIGGNSIKASSGMNAACTFAQECNNISDSKQCFAQDTIKSGQGYSNDALVDVFAGQSQDAWKFLTDLGVNLDIVSKTGGHSVARTHRAKQKKQATPEQATPEQAAPEQAWPENGRTTNVGMDIIYALKQHVEDKTSTQIITRAHVVQLLVDKDVVYGVEYQHNSKNHTLLADAVILTTGGFCGQTCKGSLLRECRPDLAHLSTTNGCCANGDGMRLAQSIGALLIDMDKVQVHPTGFVHPHSPNELRKFLAPESLRASGGILLNQSGRRFTNELGKRDDVTRDISTYCAPYRSCIKESGPIVAYLVLNEKGAALFQKKVLDYYHKRGFVQTVSNARSLAQLIQSDEGVVVQTLQEYASASAKGKDEFGKTTFPVSFDTNEPLYVMLITPCLHYSMGGLKFDEQAHVLGSNGKIENLFAAGEVTGGLHGANRLCGNSLLECVVFGRIAGQNASGLAHSMHGLKKV